MVVVVFVIVFLRGSLLVKKEKYFLGRDPVKQRVRKRAKNSHTEKLNIVFLSVAAVGV